MSVTHLHLVYGQPAHTLMDDHRFLELWRTLHRGCPHATAFQAPHFVRTWYGAYRDQWQPVVARSHDSSGDLVGLWLLAHDPITNELVHAGTHQAEYHTWLALPGHDISFLTAAWAELKQALTFAVLRFKYLPDAALGDMLQIALGHQRGVVVRRHARPLLKLDADSIRASFSKKSNKSRFNRLKKLGTLEFRRVTDSAEFERAFDDLIAYYDFRQSAVNHSGPFREDPRKRRFHSDLFAAAPSETYVTAMYLDERPIAGFWGAVSGKTVHLGMLIYSPFLAEHSPGKLHVMQLTDHLLKEGKDVLDLTPGGDPWKERFANAHDEVAEALLYRSAWRRSRADAREQLLRRGKRSLTRLGVTPDRLRSTLTMLRRVRLSAVIRKVMSWCRTSREFRVYRGDRALAKRYGCDPRVRRNSLSDLLSFEPGELWQTRESFLSSALARLEQGERSYTVITDNRLAHSGWMALNQTESYMTEVKQSMAFPTGSVALYDFYSHPAFRGRGLYRATIGHMLHAAFTVETTRYAYISVLADNRPSRHVIESMGFEYQGSFFWERRFGAERKWTSPTFARSEAAGFQSEAGESAVNPEIE